MSFLSLGAGIGGLAALGKNLGINSKFLFGSKDPQYNAMAAARGQTGDTYSDLGNVIRTLRPDGSVDVRYESSDNDKQRNSLIGQGLGSMSLDPTDVQNAYYNQASRLLNNQFDKDRRTMDTNLINRGIQTGTEQYNQVMGDMADRQNATLQDLANQSVYMGDANIGQKIGNINSLGSGRDINTLMNMKQQDSTAYDDQYKSQLYQNLRNDQRNANKTQLLFETPATGFASFTNSFFSDKRLKENLKPVGKLNNGLKVYVGNYKKETGLDTRPQLFLLAQEVKKKHPEAVTKKFGALAVNYKKATQKKGE